MYRYRSTVRRYRQHKNTDCPFCSPDRQQTIRQTKHAAVIRNLFPYDLWEFREVTDHLMVIPRRHVASLSQLTKDEQADIMALISQYEGRDYNVYSRARHSSQKSIPDHQHTHLIATKPTPARLLLHISKPYWLFRR